MWAVAALFGAIAALHVAAVFTDAINWDELAFIQRAVDSLHSGRLEGGGRPGLATLFVLPFADGCSDAVAAARAARVLWLVFTFAVAGGLFVLVRQLSPDRDWRPAALAVALLVLVPVFLRWSLQVRADQPALAFAVWGGVCAIASRRRPALALAAGVLCGLGFLASQKAAYVGVLIAVLAAGDAWIVRDLSWRRDLVRVGLAIAGGVAVIAAFAPVVAALFAPPAHASTLGAGMQLLSIYREISGYRAYRAMLPTLAPHGVLVAALAATTVAIAVRRRGPARRVIVAWVAIAAGVAIGIFHASRFPYFWMTLGLPFAAGLGVAAPAINELTARFRVRPLVELAVWLALAGVGVAGAIATTRDTQSVQAESLAFVARNFAPGARGFHPEGALACRRDPEPFPIFFGGHIAAQFSGPDREQRGDALAAEFARRPVVFVVESFRLPMFPFSLRKFWYEHYVPYRDAVSVPGRRVTGRRGARGRIEPVVAGRYRWHATRGAYGGEIRVGDQLLVPGASIELDRRGADIEIVGDQVDGALVLDLPEPPGPTRPFFDPGMRRELDGT